MCQFGKSWGVLKVVVFSRLHSLYDYSTLLLLIVKDGSSQTSTLPALQGGVNESLAFIGTCSVEVDKSTDFSCNKSLR